MSKSYARQVREIVGAIPPEEYERLKERFEKQKKEEREKKRVLEPGDYGQVIGELPKVGGRNGIKVFVRECEGHPFIEVRKWRDNKHYSGPHKQGITLQPDQVQLLTDLLEKARQALQG